MNIIEALTEHNTIAREVWPAHHLLSVETNQLVLVKNVGNRFRIRDPYQPTLADLLADDWHPVA